jgi:hypothetical protein
MKLDWKTISIVAAIVVNMMMGAYWGGTTREKVDATQQDLRYFTRQADEQHQQFQQSISDLNVRMSIQEAEHGTSK